MYLEDTTIYLYGFSINEIRIESRKVAEVINRRQIWPLVERHKTFIKTPWESHRQSIVFGTFESCNNSYNDLKLHKCTPGDEIAMRYLFWYCHIKRNGDRCAKRSSISLNSQRDSLWLLRVLAAQLKGLRPRREELLYGLCELPSRLAIVLEILVQFRFRAPVENFKARRIAKERKGRVAKRNREKFVRKKWGTPPSAHGTLIYFSEYAIVIITIW